MLILTRHPGQSLSLHPHPTLDPGTPVEQLFAEGPIQVQVLRVAGPQVHLGVAAPAGLCILREELQPAVPVWPLSEVYLRPLHPEHLHLDRPFGKELFHRGAGDRKSVV